MNRVEVNEDVTVYRIDNCMYGNPRYLIHFLTLGLSKYESSKLTRSLGLKKYRGKAFGGGFVFTSYNVGHEVLKMIEAVENVQE